MPRSPSPRPCLTDPRDRIASPFTARLVAIFAALMLLIASAQPLLAQTTGDGAAGNGVDQQTQALIELLEDDAARAQLIERLRGGAAPLVEPEPEHVPFARQVAEQTRAIAENISGVFLVAGNFTDSVSALWRDTTTADINLLTRLLGTLFIVIAGTLFGYWLLRLVSDRARIRLAARAESRPVFRRAPLALGAIAFDAGTVALAWTLGHALSIQLATNQIMALNQALFLNAFLVAEGIKVVMRAILMPRKDSLRLVPVSDTTANYWYFWLSRLVSLIVYAFFFIAPIVTWNLTAASGDAIRTLAVFTACVIGIVLVLQNKTDVATLLKRRVARGETDTVGRLSQGLAQVWHIIAIVYLITFFMVWVAHPQTAINLMAVSTAQSLIAVLVGMVIFAFISRLITGGMHLSDDVKQRLPLLEDRLNAFVPKVLYGLRIVVLLGVAVAIANAWDLFDFVGWATSGTGAAITTSLISAGLILIVGFAMYVVVSSWIEYRLNPDFGTVPTARERTLLALFRNAFTVTLSVVVAIMMLSEIGVNIGPLLAGAGVIGLALGFGAQKLVQDVITGVFIQLENAMNEGDVVTAGGISGVVERLTIRSVSMRDLNGVYHVIPFSSVDMVSNMMRNFSYHVADIGVAYRENVSEVKAAMSEAFERLIAREEIAENIIGPFEMFGVTELGDSAVTVRGRIKTKPGQQWAIGRAYNEVIKEVFDERGIEIPFPHLTLYAGEDKEGTAPPFRLARQNPDERKALAAEAARRRNATRPTDEDIADLASDIPEESGKPMTEEAPPKE
ncbi:MAG: mechanosensitive ion channel [Salinarimonas sp.]|nr:mechanosensitive ion channel [Salinarimonas sp.]